MAGWKQVIKQTANSGFGSTKNQQGMSGKTTQEVNNKKRQIEENVLNQYASYNYKFTLSGLNRSQLEKPDTILNDPIHDPIAATGGIGKGKYTDFNSTKWTFETVEGQDKTLKSVSSNDVRSVIPDAENADAILKRGADIFFERVNILAVPRPNNERKLMNFTKIEMELTEPLGVTLFEKLRACAFNNGFIDHIDAPFLLSLEFRGFDNLGKAKSVITKRFMPIKITNCEMDITNAGTTYSVTAVPWSEFGMLDKFLYTSGVGEITGPNFAEAMNNFSLQLNQAQTKQRKANARALEDRYYITVDPELSKIVRNTTNNYASETGEIVGGGIDPVTQTVADGTAISKVITDTLLNLYPFNDIWGIVKAKWAVWAESQKAQAGTGDVSYSEMKDVMVPWFKITISVYIEPRLDGIRKTHQKTVRIHVKPYDIHILNFTVPGLSANLLWGKYVKKNYDYIFTGQNTEVLDLKLFYKYGYYQSRLLDRSRREGNTRDLKDTSEKSKDLATIIKQYIGTDTYPEPLMPLRFEPTYEKSEDTTSADRGPRSDADSFFDYLTNPQGDMMRVEMQVRGDPAFIGQDMFLPSDKNFKIASNKLENAELTNTEVGRFRGVPWDDSFGCFNYDESEPLVTLNFRFPTDYNLTKGVVDFQNLENIQFNGLYKVTQVESVFDKGTFTQNLLMVRFNNQTGSFKGGPVLLEDIKENTEATQSQNQSGLGGSQETDL